MEFIFELCDDIDYHYMECHKVVKICADTFEEANARVMTEHLSASAALYIAQISRPFEDCSLAQPVFDAMNGQMFSSHAINTAKTWADILASD